MSDRVYLHVGEPKCGTTFLQQVLWAGRGQLAGLGVAMPGLSWQDQFRATQDLRGAKQPASDPGGSWHGEWDTLARQVRAASAPTAIVSHELLASATAAQAARAVASLRPAEVHIVITVRDLASLLPAEWQETVKHQNRQKWERWLASVIDNPAPRGRGAWFWTVHDTLAVLRRWTVDVPPHQVHVVTMPRPGAPKNLLWERFASVIGIDAAAVDTSVARPNASLGLAEAEMLRRLNQRLVGDQGLPQWFYSGHVKEALAHQVLGKRSRSTRLVLPAAREKWAAARAEQVVSGLKDAGYDIVGDLDELRPARVSGRRSSPSNVSDADLLDVSLDALRGLLHERYRVVTTRPRLRDLTSGGFLKLPGAYRMRRMAYDLSAEHGSVARLRVIVWQLLQRWRRLRSRS